MKNKKGFSLVELLLVIVIMSIISLLVIPNINDILNVSEKKKYTTIEDLLKTNLELYNIDFEEDIWQDGMTEYEVTSTELLARNTDLDLDVCSINELTIVKNSNNTYDYQVCITCIDNGIEVYKSDYSYCS